MSRLVFDGKKLHRSFGMVANYDMGSMLTKFERATRLVESVDPGLKIVAIIRLDNVGRIQIAAKVLTRKGKRKYWHPVTEAYNIQFWVDVTTEYLAGVILDDLTQARAFEASKLLTMTKKTNDI